MIYILLLVLLFAAELAYFRIADYFNIIDKPNERSSHSQVTLRGGGVIFYIGILLYSLVGGFQYPWFLIGLTLIAIVSFADDIKPQSRKIRLLIHFVAMGLMFYQCDLFNLPWYFTIMAFVFCTGMLNAYNFMDGINGITGGYSLVVIGSFWYINTFSVHFVDNGFIYSTLLALVVFNFFNFREKATCFAGDVGAISIAFIIVFLFGLLIIKTKDFSYIILMALYGVDSILTIVHRLILKENIFEPHRKHAFQILANELNFPHIAVSLFYCLLQFVIVVGYFSFKSFGAIYTIVVLVFMSLVYIAFKKKYYHLHQTK